MDNSVFEMYEQLEKYRKEILRGYIITAIITTALAVIICVMCRMIQPQLVFMFYIIGVIVYGFISNAKKKEYRQIYKKLLVEQSLKTTFDNLSFYPDKGIEENTILLTNMIQMGNTYSSDDYIKASYKGTEFEQSDILIQDVRHTGKTTTTVTYFKGRWMIFDFNKSFNCNLFVSEKGFNYYKKSGKVFSKSDLHKVELEDVQFNEKFNVLCDNDEEAFYILTPHIMEAIRSLEASTDGKLILCFVKNRLHIGVDNNRNAFEPPVFHKIDIEVLNNEVYNDISLITKFVDELKLDRNVYKS